MTCSFPRLFTPLKVGTATMKNRLQAAPMSIVELDPKGCYTEACYAFYESFAAGGAALVTLGETIVGTANGMTHDQQINFENPAVPYSLQRMADIIHAHGALISVEISHGGAMSDPAHNGGVPSMGPSALHSPRGGDVRQMTRQDMEEVKEAFCRAAEICRDCGYDMVMIHAGHGWLLHQFMSPLWNRRQDEYGGSVENRARFPLEVVKAVRERVGKSINLELRVSGREFMEGGSELEDCLYFCAQAQDYVDLINVSAGAPWASRMAISVFEPRGINVEFAEQVKKLVSRCPVSSVGGYTDPELMERFLAEGRCDSFVLGRSLLADPQLPEKARRGREREIHRCLRCYVCNNAQYHDRGRLLRCAINPRAGRETMFRHEVPAGEKRKVIVVGGGPGGMTAAITAAQRGHRVILVEKAPELGGWLAREKHLYFKQDMVNYAATLAYECELAGVELRLNTEATGEYLEDEGADYVLAAVGSEPFAPPVPGWELAAFAVDELGRKPAEGERIVVIGGGSVGCETALQLGHDGADVTLLEMGAELFRDGTMDYRRFLLPHLEEKVKIYRNHTVTEIRSGGVLARSGDGEEHFFEADRVLWAAGLRAREGQAQSLRSDAYELIVLGDARKPGRVYDAVRQGFDAAVFQIR